MSSLVLAFLCMFNTPNVEEQKVFQHHYSNVQIYDRQYDPVTKIYIDTTIANEKVVHIHSTKHYEQGICIYKNKIYLVDLRKPWDGIERPILRGKE